jgi:hypothetical protein
LFEKKKKMFFFHEPHNLEWKISPRVGFQTLVSAAQQNSSTLWTGAWAQWGKASCQSLPDKADIIFGSCIFSQ